MDEAKAREAYRRFHVGRHRLLLDLLARHVPARVRRCLDIGGGGDVAGIAGLLTERFVEELHAVDLGADVELARDKGISAEPCNVDLEPLPYDNGFFDVVLFASVLEHLYNPRFALDEVARVLRPGGILLLETPNALALGRRLDALFGKNPFACFNRYNAVEGKSLMVECAVLYSVSDVESALGRWFEVLERCFGMHHPPIHPLKTLLRNTAFRLAPSLGDWFAVVARRTPTDIRGCQLPA